MQRDSAYSCYDQSTRKCRECIQTEWFLTHFKKEYTHRKYTWNEMRHLNFRQTKKLAKKLGWKFEDNV